MFDTLKNLTNESLTDRRMMIAFGLKSPSVIVYKRNNNVFVNDEEIKKIEQSFDIVFPKKFLETPDDSIPGDYYPDVFASCGSGCCVLSETKEPVLIPKKCFKKPFSKVKKYSVIVARGNSMEPTIYDTDRLIVEHMEPGEQIKDNSIYVFGYGAEIYVKRLIKNIDELIIKSDNIDPIYKTKFIQKEDMNNVVVIGEIVGLIREF